jgi:hypothetical protein
MKWKYFPIRPDDHRATSRILEELKVGEKTLANKLLARFSVGTGNVLALEMENADLESLETFSYVTYGSGKSWYEATGIRQIPVGDRPIDGLISFFTEFLQQNESGAIVMQNVLWDRSRVPWDNPIHAAYCLPTRHAFFNEEVYHVITEDDIRPDLMEDTVREAWQHWLVGVCAEHVTVPDDNILSEEFFNELVVKAKHIIVSAFDQSGFLIWSPGGRPTAGR